MVCPSNPLLIVFKRTGGKLWLKPWGFTGLTQTRKENRKTARAVEATNRQVLFDANRSHWDHLAAAGALPHWGESAEKTRLRKLAANRKWALWKAVSGAHLPHLVNLHNNIVSESSRA